MSDIIDTIDALIEEQLSEGEPPPFSAKFPRCPHCDRDWHGFPLTERVAEMYCGGLFDEDYRVVEDDSPVLCPGSDAYGPARPKARRNPLDMTGDWYDVARHIFGSGIGYTFTVILDSEGNE